MLPSRGRDWALVSAVVCLQLFSMASAQSSSTQTSSSSSSPRATPGPTVHLVEVGSANDFAYHPNVTRAAVGDIVSFHFYPTNHSVVRGVYTESDECGPSGCNPCIPYELIHPKDKDKAFHSDNILTDQTWSAGNDSTVFNYTVKDESPVWFYCTAISSCAGNGMVGVINPGRLQSIDKQVTTGIKAKIELTPDQTWPYKGVPIGAMNTTVPSTPSPSPTQSGTTHRHGLSGGAIAGIAVGAAAVLILAAALFYFVGRSNTYREVIKHHRSDGAPSQVGDVHSNPTTQSPPMAGRQWQDHRISGQTAWSSMSPQQHEDAGTFVGYNRHTGAPEFAAEAPVMSVDQKTQAPPGHPAFGHGTQQGTTYELPAEAPAAVEMSQDSRPKPANAP